MQAELESSQIESNSINDELTTLWISCLVILGKSVGFITLIVMNGDAEQWSAVLHSVVSKWWIGMGEMIMHDSVGSNTNKSRYYRGH